jgi:hypothetical protein
MKITMVICIAMLCPHSFCFAADTQKDLVTVFKDAIASSINAEYFKGVEVKTPKRETRSDGSRSIIAAEDTFEGARSGQDFYIRILPIERETSSLTTGRTGSNEYQVIGPTAISTLAGASKTNPITAFADGMFRKANQFLNMGIPDAIPETVKWNGDEFSADTMMGHHIVGKLHTSKDIPVRLDLKNEHGPLERIDYTYPEDAWLLGGLPSCMAVHLLYSGATPDKDYKLKLLDVRIVNTPIPDAEFSMERVTGQSTPTHYMTNNTLLRKSKGGKLVAMTEPVRRSNPTTTKGNSLRGVQVWLFAFVPIVAYLLGQRFKRRRTRQN